MDAIHRAFKKIHTNPDSPSAETLRVLLQSLDSGDKFDLSRLYQLGYDDFRLATDVMQEWRLGSFVFAKGWLGRAATNPAGVAQRKDWIPYPEAATATAG